MESDLTGLKWKWTSASLLAGVLPCALLIGAGTASAQDGEGELSSVGALELPKTINMFGDADQNVRKATAIVNSEVITATDVEQRLALVILANEGKISDEERERLRLQVLRNLIDETLQIQEARNKQILVDKAELDQQFARVAQNFRYAPPAFAAYLKSKGSSEGNMKRQIEGEIAWSRLLRREVQPFVNVSDDEVKANIDRMKAAKGTDEFRIGEIYLSAAPDQTTQVSARVQQIMDQIRQGGSFQAYARQYSEASTAAVGGDLGWVRPGLLPPELAASAQQMEVGQIAGPIAIPGGYSIIFLIDKRQVLTADPRDAVLSLKQVGLDFPAGVNPEQVQKQATEFGEAAKNLRGCGAVADMAAMFKAEVVENDGIKARDLPPQLQNILLGLQIGQATPPFGSIEDGVRILVLCGRDDPVDATQPSFEAVMSQLEEERVGKRARTYLRDLRRDAVIDYN
jgi:peptidyl-prolyl cis-trans isomerase SurA